MPTPLRRWLPAIGWLGHYRTADMRSDLVAGMTTAAVVIPQAMAYATIAGLPLQSGLYCALVPMAVYAVVGTSRPLSVSTTSTVSLLTAQAIALRPGADPAATALTLALLSGGLLLAAGVLRLGFIADFISPHTLIGFKIGVGLSIIADQLGKVLGVTVTGGNFFTKGWSALQQLGDASLTTLALGGASVVVLLVLRRAAPRVPGPLVVLVLGIVAVVVLDLAAHGVALAPPVPQGLPPVGLPGLDGAATLLPAAAGIALMAFVESIAAARAFRRFTDPELDASQELRALGSAGVAASLTGAYPISGGLSQTAVNDAAGVATQAAQLVTAVVVLLTVTVIAPLFDNLAEATLGAIVLVAAVGLIDRRGLVALGRLDGRDLFLAAAPLACVLLFGTLQGVLLGVLLSLVLVLAGLNHPPLVPLARLADGSLAEQQPGAPPAAPGVAVLRVFGPIYYANSHGVGAHVLAWVDEQTEAPRVLVLDLTAQGDAGPAVGDALMELVRALTARGIELRVSALPTRVLRLLERSEHWHDISGAVTFHPSAREALEGATRSAGERGQTSP